MVNSSSARPHEPAVPSGHLAPLAPRSAAGHRSSRRAPAGASRHAARAGLAALLLAAVAAYPVYRFVLQDDGGQTVDAQVGTCMAAFGSFMGDAPRPATVDCASNAAHWKVTAVFGSTAPAAPCRSLGPDKGYEVGLEWRDPAGSTLCLTVTRNTSYQDFGDVGTAPYGFNEADFDTLKRRLLAATGQA